MPATIRDIIASEPIEASAPCRIDMGGTLDIATFYFPLRHLFPQTINMAMNLRTRVVLTSNSDKRVKVSSRGFKSSSHPIDRVPFDHPLGLMFAIAAYFRAEGVHIRIESASPPRGALGGSSAAAVALIHAFFKACRHRNEKIPSKKNIAMLAHALEASVAGVPCGLQDQLAAAYGGINAWCWEGDAKGPVFRKQTILKKQYHHDVDRHMLLAYCGIPHSSKDINGIWVRRFLSGQDRKLWTEIVGLTHAFGKALSVRDYSAAAALMNRETAIRRKMTPEVLDDVGKKLVESAVKNRCGARFTGAGGGGCIWALGELEYIPRLRDAWERILLNRKDACLLDAEIDGSGLA